MWREILIDAIEELGPERLGDESMQAVVAESAVLAGDADLQELARRGTVANLQLVVELLRGDSAVSVREPTPQAAAFARALAQRNISFTELARCYRVGQRAMWRFGVARLRATLDAAQAGAAIEEYTDATLATGEALVSGALDRYTTERDRWVRSVDAVRRATVQELLDGSPVDLDVASARLRYELRREHVGFVVWADEEDAVTESLAAAVGGPSALIIPLGEGAFAGWCGPGALDRTAASRGQVAFGLPGEGLAGFRRTHREAMEARRVLRLSGAAGPVDYPDVALLALLTSDLEQAREFVVRELGSLADPGAERLAETALEVLTQQGSPRRAAARLGVHENTVAKRIRAVEERLGHPLDTRPAETTAALLMLRALR